MAGGFSLKLPDHKGTPLKSKEPGQATETLVSRDSLATHVVDFASNDLCAFRDKIFLKGRGKAVESQVREMLGLLIEEGNEKGASANVHKRTR